jgi:hypothetical protein
MNKSKYNYIIVITKHGYTKKPISLLSEKRLDYAAVIEFFHNKNTCFEANDFRMTELEDVESFLYEDDLTKMKRERDEARRMYCEEKSKPTIGSHPSCHEYATAIAFNNMWDCYDKKETQC